MYMFPLVSLCTPTFNRRPFIETMFQCFRNQDYPKHKIEWIIVDDGSDKIEDLVKQSNIPQIKYFPISSKMTLGAKRNFIHSKCTGSILVNIDDDDYYPPQRISHAVSKLLENPQVLIAGASEIYVYFKHISKMYQAGPYGPNHATAGTFAFRRELLLQTRYNDDAALAEEREFLKDYSFPMVQLDPVKCILVFSHVQNTFDKKKLISGDNPYFKVSSKSVNDFIRNSNENKIKNFFMHDIDKITQYRPGDPIMKPDVMKQMKEIEKERDLNQKTTIMVQQPGLPPKALSMEEVVQLIQQQQSLLLSKDQEIQALKQKLEIKPIPTNPFTFAPHQKGKCIPEVMVTL